MTTGWKPPAPGALDDTAWPEQLTARAVQAGADDDRLHGFALIGDLARHYSFSDVLYVSLTGETPGTIESALFDLAMLSFATPHVGEAPVHLAVLARLSGAPLASALGAALIVASDQARSIVGKHTALLAWMDAPTGVCPPEYRREENPWVKRLAEEVARRGGHATMLSADLTRDAARIALLWLAGLTASQMEAAIVAARVGAIAAEAIATGPQDLSAYPVKVPPFHYVEDAERK